MHQVKAPKSRPTARSGRPSLNPYFLDDVAPTLAEIRRVVRPAERRAADSPPSVTIRRTEMSDIARSPGNADQDGEVSHDGFDEVMRILGDWRTRIDEIRVQVDLARLDLRDEADKQLDLARTVNSVAASKLRDAYQDAVGTVETLRVGVHQFLHDVDEAFDAVQRVISRD